MNKLGIAVACGLGLAILAVALYAWRSMADSELDTAGIIALTLGSIVTLGLGALLVGLMLYSSRSGYDERAAQRPPSELPPPEERNEP